MALFTLNVVYNLKIAIVWLIRIRYCRGFGIQSPSDYSFVRYVINEHYPYYDYSRLKASVPVSNPIELKLCRFYFRITNYMQARYWFDFLPHKDSYIDYVHAGCSHTQIIAIEEKLSYDYLSELFLTDNPSLLVRVTLSIQCETFLEYMMDKANSSTILILEGIRADRYTHAKWKTITADERAVVTFDLYYCGIVIFDHARSKQNYIINF